MQEKFTVTLSSALFAVVMLARIGSSQTLIPGLGFRGAVLLRPDDFAALELQEPRTDLPCTVAPIKPAVGFDFTFHSGYNVVVPMKELTGLGNELTVLFRVVPQDHKDDRVYMSQKVPVPPLDKGVMGNGVIQGTFALGEGRYHVDWLMRDQRSRVCARSWDLDAKLSPKDVQLKPWVQATFVQPLQETLFGEEPPVQRDAQSDLLKVGVIVNFASQNPNSAVLDVNDLEGLVAILRRIARDPHIGEYSLVACSLQAPKILSRQENVSRIDFPAVGEALKSLQLGLVDAKQLSMKDGTAQFMARLVREQLRKQGPDALIIVGPKLSGDVKISRETLDSVETLDRPIFYLKYNTDPAVNPWRDFIGNVVKQKRGVEYSITHPKDLFNAWSDVVSRIVRGRRSKTVDKATAKGS
jgi:hypothetical protein